MAIDLPSGEAFRRADFYTSPANAQALAAVEAWQDWPGGKLVLVGPAVNRFPAEQVPRDTLVIHGELDDVVPLTAVFDWARPQNLPIVVIPGGDHFFHGRLNQLSHIVIQHFRA